MKIELTQKEINIIQASLFLARNDELAKKDVQIVAEKFDKLADLSYSLWKGY